MLVALRLCIGWHFYKEGVKHYQDPDFTSAHMLRGATGPWADYYRGMSGGDFHQWDALLAQPLQDDPAATPAAEAGDEEIPSTAPYKIWAEQVAVDWRGHQQTLLNHFALTKEQKKAAAAVYEKRKGQLLDYLDGVSSDISDYRHELHRLHEMEESAIADDVPYQQTRIAKKQAELNAKAAGWRKEIEGFEVAYKAELNQTLDLTDEQQHEARQLLKEDRLRSVDKAVTYLTLGVGVCLMLGLFTRVAGLAGAAFLLSVISTQPPWVSGADPTYYQAVELCGLLVLVTTAAGRWGGLDYFIHNLFRKCCGAEGSK